MYMFSYMGILNIKLKKTGDDEDEDHLFFQFKTVYYKYRYLVAYKIVGMTNEKASMVGF